MDDDSNSEKPRSWVKIFFSKMFFLSLALVQMPIALSVLDINRFGRLVVEPLAPFHWQTREIIWCSILIVCIFIGGIGLADGFKKKDVDAVILGVFLGFILILIECPLTFFVGCCIEMSKHSHY